MGPRDRRSPVTKERDNQPWPACSWGLLRTSDSGRPLRGQLQEDAHDLGGGARSARLRSVRFALGDYYGSPPVGPGHFCGSTGDRNGSNAPPGGGAYDSSTKGCLLLRIPQKADCTDFSSLLYYPEGGK